jgi:transcription elongation factor GreA
MATCPKMPSTTLPRITRAFSKAVTVYDTASEEEITFKIVGEDEADIKQGKISYTSPVGKALIGHKLDDSVKAKVPAGVKEYEIIDIKYE